MAISIYLSIITLKVDEPNSPIKGDMVVEWIFFLKTYQYAAYKRLTSDIRTYTVYIVMEKIRYLMQMETKRKLYLHKTIVFKTKTITYYSLFKNNCRAWSFFISWSRKGADSWSLWGCLYISWMPARGWCAHKGRATLGVGHMDEKSDPTLEICWG